VRSWRGASLRLLWATDDFVMEPVAPDALLHHSRDTSLLKSQQLRAGRTLFAELRCIRCHSAPNQRHLGPVYSLTDSERVALRAFLRQGSDSLARYSKAETADRLVTRYACLACHDRDGRASRRPLLVAEEGRGLAPDPIPSLTWTGEKLQAAWTAKFLAGQEARPLRPWLKSRMPCFPQFAETIATGFAHQHGLSTAAPVAPAHDAELAEVGRELTLQTGLDCRGCHGIGESMPRGDDRTKLAPGINFADVRERMHYDFY